MAYSERNWKLISAEIIKKAFDEAVLVKHCTNQYEGEIKGRGDSIKIIGAGNIAVNTVSAATEPTFGDPSAITETAQTLIVNQVSTLQFMVSDLDQSRGAKKALEEYKTQAGLELADAHDKFVGGFANTGGVEKINGTGTVNITKDNALEFCNMAKTKLWQNGVKQNTKLFLEVTPKYWEYMYQNINAIDTNNHESIKNGAVGRYNGMDIFVTNNILNAGGNDYCMVRTGRAVAFVNPLIKLEPKRANNMMADEVRGMSFYDGKVVRNKEIVSIVGKYA